MILGLDGSGGKNTAIGIGMWLGLVMAFKRMVRNMAKSKESFRHGGMYTGRKGCFR